MNFVRRAHRTADVRPLNGVKPLSEYKHLFFDLDETLTATRSPMDADMRELFLRLDRSLIAVSGAENSQMATQILDVPFIRLTQNGNHAILNDGTELWKRVLSDEERVHVYAHISKLMAISDYPVRDVHDLIEDRGSQIAVSMVGHHEEVPVKRAYDPHNVVRAALLAHVPFDSALMEIRISGTATFDYTQRGKNKGSNVRALIEHMGWNYADCVYLGDKLMPGGNDETVVGVIDTIPVTSHRDTFEKLKAAFD